MDESDPASEYNRRLVDCLADPYRCQLFVEILRGTCSRASELHTKYPNIPRATMYRHLKRLTEDGLIEVVDEVKKRGTVERTYAPVRRVFEDMESALKTNPSEMYYSMFLQFVLSFVQQFREYCDDPEADLARECGFSWDPCSQPTRRSTVPLGRLRKSSEGLGRTSLRKAANTTLSDSSYPLHIPEIQLLEN